MKINYFFIGILLIIAIFSFEVGSIFLPLWAYSSIAVFSIIALVFVIARTHVQHMANTNTRLDEVNDHIKRSSYELYTQTDIRSNELKDTLKEKSDFLESSVREQSKNMTEHIQASKDAILKSIEVTNEHIDHLDNSIKESGKDAIDLMTDIKGQCASIGTDIKTIQNRALEIEKSIAILSDDDYYARIASSIHMVTSELKADLNEKIRQILQYQKDTKGEISKLEILMQAIQKSLENKTIIQTADQDDDFRVDTIVDNETDNTVTNYLKNGKIIKSIMTNPEGIIVYELEFDNGNISRSRSYNDKGDMTIEQTFYENGQVHYRHEYTSKGKTTTEFDFNGKKI
jgi:hypothetical protein